MSINTYQPPNSLLEYRLKHEARENVFSVGETYLAVPPNKIVEIAALSNAHFIQFVGIQDLTNGKTALFEGTGENRPMKALLDNGQHVETWELGVSTSPRKLRFQFAYVIPPDHTVRRASRVQQPIYRKSRSGEFWTITSEDASDNDQNDTIAFVDALNLPTLVPLAALEDVEAEEKVEGHRGILILDTDDLVESAALNDSNSWSVHGKIGYANHPGYPNIPGMSEFGAVVDWTNFPSGGYQQYGEHPHGSFALNWHVKGMTVEEDVIGSVRNVVILTLILTDCDLPGMHGARLQLQTQRSYFFRRPRGQFTDEWYFHQDGGQRTVNKVRD